MTLLEQKEQRWKFLSELRKRGIETPHAKRVAWDIMLLRVEQEKEIKRKQEEREIKLNLLGV